MQFKEWRSLAMSKPARRESTGGALQCQIDTPATSVAASPTTAGIGGLPLHTPDAAHSVPRDWNWSTF